MVSLSFVSRSTSLWDSDFSEGINILYSLYFCGVGLVLCVTQSVTVRDRERESLSDNVCFDPTFERVQLSLRTALLCTFSFAAGRKQTNALYRVICERACAHPRPAGARKLTQRPADTTLLNCRCLLQPPCKSRVCGFIHSMHTTRGSARMARGPQPSGHSCHPSAQDSSGRAWKSA